MKKKFVLHLDAIFVIALLFVVTLGVNFAQYRIYSELATENRKLQMDGLVDKFNLESMQKTIDQLKLKQDLATTE